MEIAERERSARRLNLLLRFATASVSSLDLDTVLGQLLRDLVDVVSAADMGGVYLYDPRQGLLVPNVCLGVDSEAFRQTRLLPGEATCGVVFETGQPLLARTPEEVRAAEAFRGGTVRSENARLFARGRGGRELRSTICVPLRAADGERIGTISLGSTTLPFTEDDLSLLEAVAAQVSVAIRNAQLYEQVQRHAAELERTLATLRQTQRQIIQQERLRALGQMASGIAHDLNQSLALVAGYSDLAQQALERIPADVETARAIFPIIAQAAVDGGEIVKRMLTFARGRSDGEAEPVDVGALVQEVAQLTAPRWRDAAQAEGRPIHLEIETHEGTTVLGWPAGLREAVTNLILNAVDALPAGGTIRLAARRVGETVELSVADTGVGMRPEIQQRIFEPFFTTKGERGTGLGLAQVFGIVEQQGGQIQVESTPGRGTTFHLSFPAITPPPRGGEPAPPAPPCRLHILAVDDEPALAQMLAAMLERDGHRVVKALSGEEALKRLAAARFDVVISDLGLGAGINGWELIEQIRQRWPSIRLLLATGWGAAIDPSEARARGIEAIVAKPYRVADLRRALSGQHRAEPPSP